MTGVAEVEEMARIEFDGGPAVAPTISPAEWRERAANEFRLYQFLVPILNMDSTKLVNQIEASDDGEMWMNLADSFDGLSDRMKAFSELLETGQARLMIALARVATTAEARS